MAVQLKTDRILFYTVLAIVMFGIVILYSASSVMAQTKCISRSGISCPAVRLDGDRRGRHAAISRTPTIAGCRAPAVAFSAIGLMIMLLVIVFTSSIPAHHRWLRLGPVGRAALGTGQARAGDLSGVFS